MRNPRRLTTLLAGCTTCRIRKVKCDEQRPLCGRCAKARLTCEWNRPKDLLRRPDLQREGAASPRRLAPASTVQTPLEPYEHATTPSSSIGDASHSTPAAQVVRSHADQEILPGALSPLHIPLSNSLRLSVLDQQSFLYVPESVIVLRYGKPWRWSSLSYIYRNIASKYEGVMRIFIADASMELRSKELLAAQENSCSPGSLERARRLEESAASHYHLALKDLSSLLDHISRSGGSNDDIDALFAMWFLILNFGLYDSESIGASHVHLDGIRSFLKPYLQSCLDGDKNELPFASQQLLLYIS